MALLRLDPAAAAVESGAVLECPGLRGTQKNYMPLLVGGALYLVVQTHPLVVSKVDPATLECRLVQQEQESQLDLRQVGWERKGSWNTWNLCTGVQFHCAVPVCAPTEV